MKKCDSCLKDFFAHELNEEKLCADCQALIQETFDEMEKEMPRYNSDLKELKTMLQTISNEDSRDAELLRKRIRPMSEPDILEMYDNLKRDYDSLLKERKGE